MVLHAWQAAYLVDKQVIVVEPAPDALYSRQLCFVIARQMATVRCNHVGQHCRRSDLPRHLYQVCFAKELCSLSVAAKLYDTRGPSGCLLTRQCHDFDSTASRCRFLSSSDQSLVLLLCWARSSSTVLAWRTPTCKRPARIRRRRRTLLRERVCSIRGGCSDVGPVSDPCVTHCSVVC